MFVEKWVSTCHYVLHVLFLWMLTLVVESRSEAEGEGGQKGVLCIGISLQ